MILPHAEASVYAKWGHFRRKRRN